MNYKSPLTYFSSIAATDGGSLLIDLVDAADQPVSLLLDRAVDSHNQNEIFINHQEMLSNDMHEFWHVELIRIYQETQFEYEGEKNLVNEFIKVLKNKESE